MRLVEPLGSAPDSSAAMREALAGARDAGGARRWVERRLAAGGPLAVVLVALNRFEVVNTAYGRAAGDALLRGAHRRIEEAVRETLEKGALIARMGGSEFLIATDGARERIDLAVERIAGALAKPFVVGRFDRGTRLPHRHGGARRRGKCCNFAAPRERSTGRCESLR